MLKAPRRDSISAGGLDADYFDSYFDDHMDCSYLQQQGILNWDYIQLLRQEHRTGKNDNSYPLFSLIMFDVWYRKYMS